VLPLYSPPCMVTARRSFFQHVAVGMHVSTSCWEAVLGRQVGHSALPVRMSLAPWCAYGGSWPWHLECWGVLTCVVCLLGAANGTVAGSTWSRCHVDWLFFVLALLTNEGLAQDSSTKSALMFGLAPCLRMLAPTGLLEACCPCESIGRPHAQQVAGPLQ